LTATTKLLVEVRFRSTGRTYVYSCPEELANELKFNQVVIVPNPSWRAGTSLPRGIVADYYPQDEELPYEVRDIVGIDTSGAPF
jgi:hypothetical protein